jgi:hypothetical protein
MPGSYTVRLKANGKTWSQPLAVRMDPRVKTSPAALQQQFTLSMEAYEGRKHAMDAYSHLQMLRAAIAAAIPKVSGDLATSLHELDGKAALLAGLPRRGRGGAPAAAGDQRPFSQLQNDFAGIFGILEGADLPPTMQVQTALQTVMSGARATEAGWSLLQKEITNLNAKLQAAGAGSLSFN